jgi:hypothetical protein
VTIPQFSEMLTEIDVSGIVIDPDGGAEPNGNLCTISLTRAQADNLAPDDIISFVHRAADCIDAKRFAMAPEHRMVFYCWVDEMAGQLQFSVVSSQQPLPFGGDIRVVRDLTIIAHRLLACSYLDGIPRSEFEPADDSPIDDDPYTLDVFVLDLPRVLH